VSARPAAGGRPALWQRVDELVDRSPNLEALRAHGLALYALRRYSQLGRPAPRSLLLEERTAAVRALITPTVLARVRAVVRGPIVVLKGPVLAPLYPGNTRTYNDVDLLVEDAPAAHRALLEAGFVEVEDEDFERLDIRYHLQPVAWQTLPLKIEVHSQLNWPLGLPRPPLRDLLGRAVPGELGPGLLVPAPVQHTLLLAAHGWTHQPLGSLRDLIDVAVMSADLPRDELDALARDWRLERLWKATSQAIESLLEGSRAPSLALRVLGRHLSSARERTVLESHVERLLSPFCGLPPRRALARSAEQLLSEFRPLEDERWRDKLSRTLQALRRASDPRSEHERKLGRLGGTPRSAGSAEAARNGRAAPLARESVEARLEEGR
jgi:hypothetical protein